MKQNNQTSWAARLRKISALCLALMASASVWATETLTIKPDIKAGETGKVTIALDNAEPFTAFQMQLTLPAGLSMAFTGAMEIVSTVSADHNVDYNYNPVDNVVTIAAYSFDGASSGNNAFNASGDLLIITVTADASYAGGEFVINQETDEKAPNYDKRLIFITAGELEAFTDFTIETEAGEEILPGDVNGDGSVDMKDALAVIQYYVGKNPENFNAAVADLVAEFGVIDMKDALAIVKIYAN